MQTGMFRARYGVYTRRFQQRIWALYRGRGVPLSSLLLKRPLEFYIFEELQRRNPCGLPDSWKGFGHGSVAGVTGAFVGARSTLLKARTGLQNSGADAAGSSGGTDVTRKLSNGAIVEKLCGMCSS